jgi:hypothetical protein
VRASLRSASIVVGLAASLSACSYDVRLGVLGTETANLDAPVEPGSSGEVVVRFVVRSDQDRRSISPLIYGTVERTGFGTHRQTLVRRASAGFATYNWENNASNPGKVGSYANGATLTASDVPGEAVRPDFLEAAAQQAAVVLPLPILDYVAADQDDSGDVRDSGPDYLQTRFKQNVPGDPAAAGTVPDRTDAVVSQAEFVRWVRSVAPDVQVLFSMGDEPDLVRSDHIEVHPDPVTYQEIVDRNLRFADAVKEAWPEAATLGPASYGWSGWTQLEDPITRDVAPDAATRGEFLSWYLAQMHAAEVERGRRIIDYVDVHWMSEAQGDAIRVSAVNSPQGAVARVQAPRSLWDESYVEDSWITTFDTRGPIALIPRILRKIDADYPGTQLSIGKWNFGGHQDISGTIAVADTLGIFGRFGVGAAAMTVSDGPFVWSGLYVYRNFDGAGGEFGDTSIAASTTDIESSSVYASVDATDPARVVVVAINKRDSDLLVGLEIAHPVEFSSASLYVVRRSYPDIQPIGTIDTVARNAFRWTLPAASVTVLVPIK